MFNQSAKALSLDRILLQDGLSFGVVRHRRQAHLSFVQSVDALIIQTNSSTEALGIVREVRQLSNPDDYLKPLFLHPIFEKYKHLQSECNGITDTEDLDEAAEKAREIFRLSNKLPTQTASHQHLDGELLVKLSQYLYTRKKALEPSPDRYAKLHYRFPFLTSFFEEKGEQKALSILKLGEKQGWFNTKVVDKLHLCPECDSAHHNLRACCPKCFSVDIVEEDLVHHFPCAHIAPMSDFQKKGNDGLHCPKCDKSLRHIGNDYDKPSAIFNCHSCHHTFQQPEFRALCIECETEVSLEKLKETVISNYELTAKAKSALQNGEQISSNTASKKPGLTEPGVFEFDVFKILVRQEMMRQKTQEKPTAMVGQVKIDGLPIQDFPEEMQTRLSSEVCKIIKSYLSPADAVSSKGAKTYFFMLSEAEEKLASNIKEVLTFNLNKLISSNLREKNANVQVDLEPLLR